MKKTGEIVRKAQELGVVIPAFNVPYLPMVKPVIEAVADQDSFALIETAKLEWDKFEAKGPAEVYEEFMKWNNPDHIRLHLDHVPVIDEDHKRVDYLSIVEKAIEIGYQSVMVDGSRLDLDENIEATRKVAELAHEAGIVCEAELGAVLGHEAGPLPPYEEIFESGEGFTNVEDAERFVSETGCDWLSVAIGNVHGAVSEALRNQKKPAARLDIDHLNKLGEVTGIPLVLHGGSGVRREYVLKGIENGIAKINVGTEIRQAYEKALRQSDEVETAREATYERVSELISDYFNISGTADKVTS